MQSNSSSSFHRENIVTNWFKHIRHSTTYERMVTGLYYNVLYIYRIHSYTCALAVMENDAVVLQSAPGKHDDKEKPRPVAKAGLGISARDLVCAGEDSFAPHFERVLASGIIRQHFDEANLVVSGLTELRAIGASGLNVAKLRRS